MRGGQDERPQLTRDDVERLGREDPAALAEAYRTGQLADFVTTRPLKGLGVDMALVERIVGTGDPDLLVMLHEANKGKAGRPRKGEEFSVDSTENNDVLAGRDRCPTFGRSGATG